MKWTILFLIALGSIVISCSQKESVSNQLNCEIKDWNYSDYFYIDTIIQLETLDKCLISQIGEIQIFNNRIYILDKKSKRVYLFDSNGRYLNHISAVGKGPNEYLSLADMEVNNDGLFLLSWQADCKLMHYDHHLNFIEESPFPVNCQTFKYYDDGCFCYNANICNTKALTNYNLLFFDKSFKQKWQKMPFVKSYCGRTRCFGISGFNNQFSISHYGKLMFYEPYSNKVSYLSKNGIDSTISINYGESVPENIRNKMEREECLQFFKEGNKIQSLSNVFLGTDYLHFNLFTTQCYFRGISIEGNTIIKDLFKGRDFDEGFGVSTSSIIGYDKDNDRLISCLDPGIILNATKGSEHANDLIMKLKVSADISDNPSLMFLKRKNGSK